MWWWSISRFNKTKTDLFKFYKMASAADPVLRNESTAGGELLESVVCQNSDLKENEMKVFEIGKEGDQVLLVKQQGKVYAIGNKCSHYGAPLVNGALGKGRVRCPWHGACFNIQTGDIEDFPGLDGIPRYDCEIIAGGGVRVKAYKSQLKENKRFRLNRMMTVTRDPKNTQTFVIIGAGAAGNNCAETLRHQGFQGRIVLVSGEKYLPYDRIKLSKVLNVDPPSITLRSESFYKDADIDLILDTKATKIKTDDKYILLSNGSQLEYNKVFIATGSRGRTVKMHGSDLHNIFTLRNIDDGKNIHSLLSPEKDVVIVGASFIGMEVASYCVGKVKSVTVVSRTTLPFNRLGDPIGERIAELFKSKGVKFEMNNVVEKYVSVDGITVSSVVLRNNDVKLQADIVIIGLGVEHNTEFLAGSEIIMKMDGSIPVDKFLETNVKGVYAGGDIAYAPVFVDNDRPATIGHWQLSHYHGYIAAFNMLAKARPLQSVPFFWTVLFGLSFRYAGVASSYDDVVITGSLKDLKFVAYYCDGDKVTAILTVGSDPLAAKFAELLYNNKRLRKADVTKTKIDWMEGPTF